MTVLGRMDGTFVIVRGKARVSYFSFFVDGDKTSWSTWLGAARRYPSEEEANMDLQKIRKRHSLKSKEARNAQ